MWWRDVVLVIVSLVLGPPIASLVLLLGSLIGLGGLAALSQFDVLFYLATLPFSYFLAGLPMLIAAICNVVSVRLVPEIWRLVLALPIGAVSFIVFLGWLAESETEIGDFSHFAGIGLGGALASLISLAVVEAFWPQPQPIA